MKKSNIFGKYKNDMHIIEKALYDSVVSRQCLLNETTLHLLKAGGKRIRPIFVLLGGQFGTYNLEVLKQVAIALELIHSASLVHDDVIDDAHMRRGKQTVKSKWDNEIAMYTGDYIYAKALSIIANVSDPYVHQVLSKTMVQMCIGEMEQIRDLFNTSQTIRHYLLRIRRKTALLIGISCRLGAVVTGAPIGISRQLYRYGYNVGMAFQIQDDILDIIGNEWSLGKPPGSDMRQGNITLPVLYALQEMPLREELLKKINGVKHAGADACTTAVIQMIRQSQAIEKAEALAEQYRRKALSALCQLPKGEVTEHLKQIAHFIVKRTH